MNFKSLFVLFVLLVSAGVVRAQSKTAEITLKISVSKEIKSSFKSNGRLMIYFSEVEKPEPRYSSAFNGNGSVFGKNIESWGKNEMKSLSAKDNWTKTSDWNLDAVPQGDYYVQAVWVQNRDVESRVNTPGNIYSKPVLVKAVGDEVVAIEISEMIPERELADNELVKFYSIQSEILSEWWNKPMGFKVSVLLPSGYYSHPDKKYPVRYNVAGYGGRYTRINRLANDEEFIKWWTSDEAPQIVTVFLDGEGPFGDCYHLDSENSGPYGEAFTKELIPNVEKEFRIVGDMETRFVDGCSTGGWVSLAIQLYYPETFNGCWSYSPDPVSFKRMQLVNIYEDENAFYNKRHYLRPSKRDLYGEPEFSIKEEVYGENVAGMSNTYVTSGEQWGAWNALYSQKGADGLPKPLFDPVTGAIDKEVAEHWKKYDLLLHVSENWQELGPELQGKIHIWMGDMDNFYLNNSMRDFDEFLKSTTNPESDAEIVFSPMCQHCQNYSHKIILEKIQEKLENK